MPTNKDFDWGGLFGSLLGNIGPLYGLGRTISGNNMPNMGEMINYGREAGVMADPFASQRGQYQQQMQQLMTDPSSIEGTPGYQFRLGQGINAIDRSAAARGMLNSGNRLYDLENYAQGLASAEYDNQLNRLMTLSGATTGSPAAAGQALMQGVTSGYNMQDDRYGDMMEALSHLQGGQNGGLLGSLGSGLGSLLGQGASGLTGLLGRLFDGGSNWDLSSIFGDDLSNAIDFDLSDYLNQTYDVPVDTDWINNVNFGDWADMDWSNFDWGGATDWGSVDWGDMSGWVWG